MPRVARRVAPMTLVAMLMAGAVAFASADLRYSGVTSQGLPVELRASGHGVSFFWIQLRERCYTRQGRFVGGFGAGYSFTSFPPLTIGRRGRFSHRQGGNNLLYGVVHGRTAAGMYRQTDPGPARSQCVTGKVRWSARAH